MVTCGAAAASSFALSVFNPCSVGALRLPPLCPAVLEPDLVHRMLQRETTKGLLVKTTEDGAGKLKETVCRNGGAGNITPCLLILLSSRRHVNVKESNHNPLRCDTN